ncbi:MAG: integrase [Verrucomicrobiales bacterium]|jgi:integrase
MRSRSASKKVSLKPCTHPRYKWRVFFPDGGTRKGCYFRLKRNAEAFMTEKENELHEHGGALIADKDASAVRDYRDRITAVGGSVREALSLYVKAKEAEQHTVPISEAVGALLTSKRREEKSHRYLLDLKSRLARFSVDFGDQAISSVTTEQLNKWLYGLGVAPTTYNNFRRILCVLWSFAAKKGWSDAEVARGCEVVKAVDGKIGILTPTELAVLLNACDEETLPAVAIGAFAGLRRAEIERLDWDEVDLQGGHIEIKASKAKSARRRLVTISNNLKQWLASHAVLKGPVMPTDYQERILLARERAELHEWPQNGLRHSYASYHLAHFRDAARLALELGHTTSGLIFANYREVVKPKDAEAYWQVMPSNADEKVVSI